MRRLSAPNSAHLTRLLSAPVLGEETGQGCVMCPPPSQQTLVVPADLGRWNFKGSNGHTFNSKSFYAFLVNFKQFILQNWSCCPWNLWGRKFRSLCGRREINGRVVRGSPPSPFVHKRWTGGSLREGLREEGDFEVSVF